MKIPEWSSYDTQMCQLGDHHWSVSRLVELSKDLKVMDIPLDHLYLYYRFQRLSLRDMAMHINAINAADLSYPIIMDEDGEIMDGRHRVIKALINGDKTIKAVRFDENPSPCKVDSEQKLG